MLITPVILAGGSGKRLWPLSTAALPKPFVLSDEQGQSLFQATVARVLDRAAFLPPLIVANEAHRFLIMDQLSALGCSEATILLEPEPRNTGPAIALAMLHLAAQGQGHQPMLVLPADHRITRPDVLLEAIAHSQHAVEEGYIVTFSIPPTRSESGYGYIHRGNPLEGGGAVHAIRRFIEKPSVIEATRWIASGDYGWNSGIFWMTVQAAHEQLLQNAPQLYASCREAYAGHQRDAMFLRPEVSAFAACPSVSFDVAVMEHCACAATVMCDMGWSDMGSWEALAAITPVDGRQNAIQGNATVEDSTGCFIHSDLADVHIVGLRDALVVAHKGQLLVAPKALAHTAGHAAKGHQNPITPVATYRPWGQFAAIDSGPRYQVKKLRIRVGEKISLQMHRQRSEHWVVVQGTATVTRGDERFTLRQNQSTYIEAGVKHCLANEGNEELIIIEVQTGSYLGEDDIERF